MLLSGVPYTRDCEEYVAQKRTAPLVPPARQAEVQ
jgi:hypothetical protein